MARSAKIEEELETVFNRSSRRRIGAVQIGILGLALTVLIGHADGTMAQDKVNLIVAVLEEGTPSNALGGAVASTVSKYVRGYSAKTSFASSQGDCVKAVGNGKADMAFATTDTVFAASRGEGEFKDAKLNLRVLAAINPYRMHIVTFEGSGIDKLADFKGRRLSTGPAASATEIVGTRLLETMGLSDRDIRRQHLAANETLAAMRDGKIDAFLLVGGLPLPLVRDVSNIPGKKIKLIESASAVDAINKKFGPLYAKGAIPAKTYAGQTTQVGVIEAWTLLVTRATMNDRVAYNVVKTIFERKDHLAAAHSDGASLSLSRQRQMKLPVAFHPGALKYYAEKGGRAAK